METKDFCKKMRELLDLMEDSCKEGKSSKKGKKEDYSKEDKKGDVDSAVKIIKLSLGR